MTIAPQPPLLLAAIRRGDEPAALQLLVTGCHEDVNASDPTRHDGSALFWAASRGMAAVARKLLERGAHLSARSGTGCTPLHAAADGGQPKVIRLLLRAGADVRLRNVNGSTPAHLAAFRGNTECLRILLHAGSDIMSQDNAGKTPYIYGMLTGDSAMWNLVQEMKNRSACHQVAVTSSPLPDNCGPAHTTRLLSHSFPTSIQTASNGHVPHYTEQCESPMDVVTIFNGVPNSTLNGQGVQDIPGDVQTYGASLGEIR